MPNLKQLKLLRELMKDKQALKETGELAGLTSAGVGLMGSALYDLERANARAEAKTTGHNQLKKGVGMTGSIETRPTADIASRIESLKENIPNVDDFSQQQYRDEQEELAQELRFRKLKEALRKNNE
jgi:hypothetical protein